VGTLVVGLKFGCGGGGGLLLLMLSGILARFLFGVWFETLIGFCAALSLIGLSCEMCGTCRGLLLPLVRVHGSYGKTVMAYVNSGSLLDCLSIL